MPGARAPVVVRAPLFPAVRGPHPSPARSLPTCPHSITLPLIHSFIHTLSRHFLICLPTHARTCPALTCSFMHSILYYLIQPHSFIRTQPVIHSLTYPYRHSFVCFPPTHSQSTGSAWASGRGALRIQRCTGTYSDVGDGKGPSGGSALAVPKQGCGSTQVRVRSPEEGRDPGWGRA